MTLRYFVDSWSTWSYQRNSKWRLSSGCRQKYSSWFFRLFSPSLIKTYILVQLTNEEKLFLNRRWQQSNDRYGNISSWRMLKSSMIFPSFLLHSWSKYPFLFFSSDEMLAKNTRMHDLGRNYSKILHKLNIFERLVDGDSNGFLTNFASFFLQVSVTIWHLPIRERERKNAWTILKKNNGPGLTNKLNDSLENFFRQKQPAIFREVLFTSIDD